jgi:hypothetical protein
MRLVIFQALPLATLLVLGPLDVHLSFECLLDQSLRDFGFALGKAEGSYHLPLDGQLTLRL